MAKSILVVSAHPDDEILGAGGTMIRHRDNGDELHWIIVTNIFEKHGFSPERVASRQKEIEKISEQLQIKNTFLFDFPTMSLSTSSLQTLIPKVSKAVIETKPEIIYCLNRSDAHSDHRIVFDAVMACTKSFRYPFIREVLLYECISETEFAPAIPEKVFQPNCYVDISNQLAEKMELMKIYESELGEHPFPRSIDNIKALATFRGATAGVKYAEAFQLIKSLKIEKL